MSCVMLSEQALILLIHRINNSFKLPLLRLLLFYLLIQAVKSINIRINIILEVQVQGV